MDLLERYQHGSGQMVNMAKSAIFFSVNCDEETKERVKGITGIQTEALCEKYLGLPTALGRSSTQAFETIPGRIMGLVRGWGEKQLKLSHKQFQLIQ
ncbi:hypothetical protein PR202_gb08490 [Eleusine coracana subsp. coracana]|uniref:Uncharacterized protein n=1 Tax=Eleusine coracana subsp. coracana TaxID=191504 RepID=A0AAV5ECD2_ELECO|nr:hypothetical protein PR202_gb08490 [Eleusine coracana subsp. coracana]